jgi:hypothetical protein
MEVGVVKREIPLRMEDAAEGLEDYGFGRVTSSDEAKKRLVRNRPVEFADTAKVSDRKMADGPDPIQWTVSLS